MTNYTALTSIFAVIIMVGPSPSEACAPLRATELKAYGEARFNVFADIEFETISQPFGIGLYFCGNAIDPIVRIKVDATMPAHQHGMNYAPEITRIENGNFSVSGMFFHMPGIWQLEVRAYHAPASDIDPMLFTLEIMAK